MEKSLDASTRRPGQETRIGAKFSSKAMSSLININCDAEGRRRRVGEERRNLMILLAMDLLESPIGLIYTLRPVVSLRVGLRRLKCLR